MGKKTGRKTVKIKDLGVKDAKTVKGGVVVTGRNKYGDVTLK